MSCHLKERPSPLMYLVELVLKDGNTHELHKKMFCSLSIVSAENSWSKLETLLVTFSHVQNHHKSYRMFLEGFGHIFTCAKLP